MISTELSKLFSLGEQWERQVSLSLITVSFSADKSQTFSVLLPWKPITNTVQLIFLNILHYLQRPCSVQEL